MKILSYKSASGRDIIMDYINSLQPEETADALSVLQCMGNNEFDKIYYKPWRGKVYEVYFRKSKRIFYITVEAHTIYIIHACQKQKGKTEKKDADIVIKRAKEIGKIYNKKFI